MSKRSRKDRTLDKVKAARLLMVCQSLLKYKLLDEVYLGSTSLKKIYEENFKE